MHLSTLDAQRLRHRPVLSSQHRTDTEYCLSVRLSTEAGALLGYTFRGTTSLPQASVFAGVLSVACARGVCALEVEGPVQIGQPGGDWWPRDHPRGPRGQL